MQGENEVFGGGSTRRKGRGGKRVTKARKDAQEPSGGKILFENAARRDLQGIDLYNIMKLGMRFVLRGSSFTRVCSDFARLLIVRLSTLFYLT